MEIQETREEEAETLSDIRVRSKGHWGYSRETLEAWRPAMAVTRDYIRDATVRSIFVDGCLVGFYALKKEEGILDHLWLVPEVIGKGVGRFAFAHAISVARGIGMRTLLIVSDADAEGFYLKMGAQKIGEFYSPHQNRMLPKLLFRIPEEPDQAPRTDSLNRIQHMIEIRPDLPETAAALEKVQGSDRSLRPLPSRP